MDVPTPGPRSPDGSELVVLSRTPFNAETDLREQFGIITPTGRHYVRNHFAVPEHPGVLTVGGAVGRPFRIPVAELEARPSETVVVTLECAGNGRSYLDPPVPGEQWQVGAVGTAEWTGVLLRDVLEEAELDASAVEILVRGADRGTPKGLETTIAFERSVPRAEVGRALLAYAMNGRRLPPEHGAPLRLVVPGTYGMASVKWVTHLIALAEPFSGFFQADRYVVDGRPVGPIRPRAVITGLDEGRHVPRGPQLVRGYAWSGGGEIVRVDLSTDGGARWTEAELGPQPFASAWRPWHCRWSATSPGTVKLLARATDASGEQQPLQQVWNALGYRNNATLGVTVTVDPDGPPG